MSLTAYLVVWHNLEVHVISACDGAEVSVNVAIHQSLCWSEQWWKVCSLYM